MNDKHLHTDKLLKKSADFFSQGEVNWKMSEQEVWENLNQKIQEKNEKKQIVFLSRFAKIAVAAIFLLLMGLSAVFFFYTKTIEAERGEHILAVLPDGSTVDLNAGSLIRYYPLKWHFKRSLQFEGEAFFRVQKGKTFEVISREGKTTVLGTSFNVYSRHSAYKVTCLTGSVKVTAKNAKSVVLNPNQHVEIMEGELLLQEEFNTEESVAWRTNQFYFSGTPLKEVFAEIERQYGVTINIDPGLMNRKFAGNFQKKPDVENVIDFICKSMQINYEKSSDHVFLVREKK